MTHPIVFQSDKDSEFHVTQTTSRTDQDDKTRVLFKIKKKFITGNTSLSN